MKRTGAEIIMECLLEQGVDTIFGYPGGAVLNIYDALYASLTREAGLQPASPWPLPKGVLTTRRDGLLFLQNCNDSPVSVSGVELPGYGTAVWADRDGSLQRLL